ncbi:MAG: ATP-binding protein [Bacteroidaceae bacterium]|nr:ATP-binding protein [Bacteroidaceae bacterium]
MKFFGREYEIQKLRETKALSQRAAQFTVLTGRRRIGKTSLVMNAFENDAFLYFFVTRSTESVLCEEFVEEITSKLQIPVLGKAERFADIFDFVMELSKTRPLTLMIDEFQDFSRVNGAIFSQMQKIWDQKKGEAKINLIVCGSVYSMMTKLFRDKKEPLYGRQTEFLKLEPFTPSVMKEILEYYHPGYTKEDLLAIYAYTGGVAKYVELLMDAEATTWDKMLRRIVAKNSYFIYEGKNMLIEEFGRDYGRYFDILKLIATGHNTRGDIEGILHAEVSGYMTRLENDYGLIAKNKPMFQKSANKNIVYEVNDLFLQFWFRFIYKYNHFIEANAYGKLAEIIERDYETYTGKVLERYFKDVMRESGQLTHIDKWWDRRGENEIDIIAADDLEKWVTFYEVKRQRSEIDLSALEKKVQRFKEVTGEFKRYEVSLAGLSMEDM